MILFIDYIPSMEQKAAPPGVWKDKAVQIASLDGLRWKYWLRSTEGDHYGGVYLFDTTPQAQAGGEQLRASLAEAGARDVSLRFFDVDADLSAVTRGLIP